MIVYRLGAVSVIGGIVIYSSDGANCVLAVGKEQARAARMVAAVGADGIAGRSGFAGAPAKRVGACCVALCGTSDEVSGFIFIPGKQKMV